MGAVSPRRGLLLNANSSLKPMLRVPVGATDDGAWSGTAVGATVAFGTAVAWGAADGVEVALLPQATKTTRATIAATTKILLTGLGDLGIYLGPHKLLIWIRVHLGL
jgi:hypothetical protein